jgi:hypothetical protein
MNQKLKIFLGKPQNLNFSMIGQIHNKSLMAWQPCMDALQLKMAISGSSSKVG